MLALAGLVATGWLTPWLDPHVPALADWRHQARRLPLLQPLAPRPEHWQTVAPRDKAACLQAAGGELNASYMLCRSGSRQLVRDHPDGSRTVLQTEPLREPEGIRRSNAP